MIVDGVWEGYCWGISHRKEIGLCFKGTNGNPCPSKAIHGNASTNQLLNHFIWDRTIINCARL